MWFVVQSGISGWYESSIIHDVINNRTVNLRGGLGHNIAMDRVCEFLNAEFKGFGVYLLYQQFVKGCTISQLFCATECFYLQ